MGQPSPSGSSPGRLHFPLGNRPVPYDEAYQDQRRAANIAYHDRLIALQRTLSTLMRGEEDESIKDDLRAELHSVVNELTRHH